jgi:hypothetical protein
MFVGSFNLEQNSDLEKHYNLLQGVGKLGSKHDHNATKGEFGTTILAHTQTQQSLGASQVNFFFSIFSNFVTFFFVSCVFKKHSFCFSCLYLFFHCFFFIILYFGFGFFLIIHVFFFKFFQFVCSFSY